MGWGGGLGLSSFELLKVRSGLARFQALFFFFFFCVGGGGDVTYDSHVVPHCFLQEVGWRSLTVNTHVQERFLKRKSASHHLGVESLGPSSGYTKLKPSRELCKLNSEFSSQARRPRGLDRNRSLQPL